MRTIPSAIELLEVTAEYLRKSVATKLGAPEDFYVLVAANTLDIVRRELELGSKADAAAQARIAQLLQTDGALEALDTQLADAIANGCVDIQSPPLLEHLLRTTLDEMAIDQPRYATYRLMLRTLQAEKDL
jgi:hypothetical protein